MSRTYRKRQEPFNEEFYSWWAEYKKVPLKNIKSKYNRDCWWDQTSLPKWFRNQVNRQRRAEDRQTLYRAVNHENDPQLFCEWNCKSANHWGYW